MTNSKAATASTPQPAAATPEVAVEELPKAIVRRVVKDKLAQSSSDGDGDISLHKDALQAFSESARIFIHYLSATANDICKESKRQTINADDVLKALEEIEFPEFIDPLKAALDDFRQKNALKKAGSAGKGENKKRKAEEKESAPTENENDGGEVAEVGEEAEGGEEAEVGKEAEEVPDEVPNEEENGMHED